MMRYRYTLYGSGGDILDESSNKKKIIKECNALKTPGTVVDERVQGIIHENKAQRIINNS